MELNRRTGRHSEPVAPGTQPLHRETSQVLEKVFQALRQDKITKAAIAKELRIPLADLNDSVFGLVMTPLEGGAAPAGRDSPPSGDPPKTNHLRAV